MQAITVSPTQLLTIFLGKEVQLNQLADGLYLLAAQKNDSPQLPSEMAGAIVAITASQVTLVSLVHPFAVNDQAGIFNVDDAQIHREPYNWFGPQALVIEKKLQDFLKNYDGPRDDQQGVPRQYIPDEIARPVLLSDQYWQDYIPFVNDSDGQFAAQIKPIFTK
ncbi:hypothetical protein [Convivina praedatoris]|uniref:Uncharacterized protein n=1 Tax=Convivina praedatoris TaxID=2880963 RepID=A0ABM9D0Y1_9LACO|nr:hypothetical protein [Convivina sp. LMG 32447]CAH1850029.1 hypothetical protein R077815_00048 [Convivina sp. LMG 32447]CAH1850038.1 hypothetical protein LMG032447_00050 [Convivina sp. LMG 32447]CAH1851179.1 hypothetical protein R078138_00282 [Convivina sp. LMG 32447]